MKRPCRENCYLNEHGELLISNYHRFTGKNLVERKQSREEMYRLLYEAPFGVVSHGTEDDPIFNYGNLTAQKLFQMSWSDLTQLPSRESAAPINQADRERLLARVGEDGFVDGYRGVRISSTGARFWIEDTTIWNLIDEVGVYRGQAAVFYSWSEL